MDNDVNNLLISIVERVETKVDKINDNMVTKEDCKKNQLICNQTFKRKKIEFTAKNITAIALLIGSLLTGIVAIIKLI